MNKLQRLNILLEAIQYSQSIIDTMYNELEFEYDEHEAMFIFRGSIGGGEGDSLEDVFPILASKVNSLISGYKAEIFEHEGLIYCNLVDNSYWYIYCTLPLSFVPTISFGKVTYTLSDDAALMYLKNTFGIYINSGNIGVRFSTVQDSEDRSMRIEIDSHQHIDVIKSCMVKVYEKLGDRVIEGCKYAVPGPGASLDLSMIFGNKPRHKLITIFYDGKFKITRK